MMGTEKWIVWNIPRACTNILWDIRNPTRDCPHLLWDIRNNLVLTPTSYEKLGFFPMLAPTSNETSEINPVPATTYYETLGISPVLAPISSASCKSNFVFFILFPQFADWYWTSFLTNWDNLDLSLTGHWLEGPGFTSQLMWLRQEILRRFTTDEDLNTNSDCLILEWTFVL